MKLFVTILTAAFTSLAAADISLSSVSSPSSFNNNSPHPYSRQQLEPISQQQTQQIISKPSLNYISQPEQLVQFSHHPAVKTGRRYRPRTRIPKKPIVTKNFYLHSAPDDTEEELEQELATWQQQPRKHYNVLFVKAPSQTSKAAALNLAKSLKQEKTIVYVLAKKTSAAELQDAVEETPQALNKPEVFFIKYRTAEEAANAQRQIQSQYDRLGGVTTINDEGIAPSTSVIGSLDASEEEDGEGEEDEDEEEYAQVGEQRHEQSSDVSQEGASASAQYGEVTSNTNGAYLPPQQ